MRIRVERWWVAGVVGTYANFRHLADAMIQHSRIFDPKNDRARGIHRTAGPYNITVLLYRWPPSEEPNADAPQLSGWLLQRAPSSRLNNTASDQDLECIMYKS